MRTLTKERVDLSSLFNSTGTLNQSLIMDGPNEIVCKKITEFRKDNESISLLSRQTSLVRNEEQRKRNFAISFVNKYTATFGVTPDQLGELINSLKAEDILILDNQLTGLLQKKTLLHNIGWSTCIGTFLLSTLSYFLSGNNFFAAVSFFMFISTLGWLFPLMALSDNFYSEKNSIICVPYYPAGHMALRRYLKNKYGSEYFPTQELKKELGLLENSDTYT